jgi:beta-lactamase regulating signal transducer with metallopeptidase domain
MDTVLNWLWQGSVVTLALLVTLRLLTRAHANVRYVVCWVALLLVLTLPAISSLLARSAGSEVLAIVPPMATVSVPDAWWTSEAVMAVAWSLWFGVHAVRLARAVIALRRARVASRPFPSHVESQLPHWQRACRSGRRPSLVLSDSVTAAAVLGCGAPTIAVAPSILTALEAGELDRVLMHEWAHVRRRDDLAHLLQIVIRAVAGWHPAVWWIERRLHVEREIACDEMTVAMTGSAASYAACLVKLAGARGVERTALAAPAVLKAAGLRARVTRIVSRRPLIAPARARRLAAGVVSVLGAVALGVGALRLVEPTVMALPLESIPFAEEGVGVRSPAPTATLVPLSRPESVRSSRQSDASAASPQPAAASPAASAPASLAVEPVSAPERPATLEPAPPQPEATTQTGSDTPPNAASVAAATAPVPVPDVTVEPARSPWTEVADRGSALGRKSKDAGVATAGFFSRLGRRVAGEF